VSNRRRGLLEILTLERLFVLLYLAVGLGSLYRHDPYGWLVLSLLALGWLSWILRRRLPESSHAIASFVGVIGCVAMGVYGAICVLHRDRSGWGFIIIAVVGVLYVALRRHRSVGKAKS
jgi:hypothetical protein